MSAGQNARAVYDQRTIDLELLGGETHHLREFYLKAHPRQVQPRERRLLLWAAHSLSGGGTPPARGVAPGAERRTLAGEREG
jgi:hypothetical protein